MIGRPRPSTWLLVLAGIALALATERPVQAAEECATCHEDKATAFAKTPHGARYSAGVSCSSCHGTGEAHVAASGEGGIDNPGKGKAADANKACLTCHQNDRKRGHWQGSAHEAAGLRCSSCHAVHEMHGGAAKQGKELPGIAEGARKCLECHGNVRAALSQRSSHPMKNGQMECASCHNPHGSAGEKLIEKASVNDLCYSCHQQMRGPFLWEHSPVREDCLTCHKAHGSNNPSLLQARTTQLCQSCHQQGRHQTVAGVPNSVWVSNKACVNCHTRIHGSNHPSGPLFQR